MNEYPIVVQKIQNDTYVNDLVSGGSNLVEVENLKQKSIELFSKGGFNLHKWNSNIPSLENDNTNFQQTYAKQLFSSNSGHTKILGLDWNKITDKINIEILQFSKTNNEKKCVKLHCVTLNLRCLRINFSQSYYQEINLA